MKNPFESALAIGACISSSSGVIAMAVGTVSGLIGAFLAIAFGGKAASSSLETLEQRVT